MGLAAAEKADVVGVAVEGEGEGWDIELGIVEEDDDGPSGTEVLGGEDLLGPAEAQVAALGEAFRLEEGPAGVAHHNLVARRLAHARQGYGDVRRAEDEQGRGRGYDLDEDLVL